MNIKMKKQLQQKEMNLTHGRNYEIDDGKISYIVIH